MNRLSVKLFVEESSAIDTAAIALLFHRIIQEDLLPHEQVIDVVSYRHVFRGPWVLMICTEGLYAFDGQGGRPGLKYSSRTHTDLSRALKNATAMAIVIERELGLRFRTAEAEVELLDRKTYPNTREGFAHATAALAPMIGELYDHAEVAWAGAADLLGPMRLGLHTERRSTLAHLQARALAVAQPAARAMCNVA